MDRRNRFIATNPGIGYSPITQPQPVPINYGYSDSFNQPHPAMNQQNIGFYQNQPNVQNNMTQQQPAQSFLRGRMVQNSNDIAPNETIMDNVESYFPLADGSEIIVKRWNNQGVLEEAHYVLDKQVKPSGRAPGVNPSDFEDFKNKMDKTLGDLWDELYSIRQQIEPPPAPNRNRQNHVARPNSGYYQDYGPANEAKSSAQEASRMYNGQTEGNNV